MKTRIKPSLIFVTVIATILSCKDDESNEIFLDSNYCTKTTLNCSDNYPLVLGYIKKG